jgi:hypothetical protein
MPSSSTRRSPRAAPPARRSAAATGERPLAVPFAAAFGLLVAAEDVYLAWLLWQPDYGLEWFVSVGLLLALAAVAGAVLVLLGRARGWLLLAAASVLPLLALLALAVLFGVLGGGSAMWWAVLLLVGPLGCLALTLRRSVRTWCGPARRSPGGPRPAGRSG